MTQHKVKIITTVSNPRDAHDVGGFLTKKIDAWIEEMGGVDILSVEINVATNIYSVIIIYNEPPIPKFVSDTTHNSG